mgnify:CR=1 FL=1
MNELIKFKKHKYYKISNTMKNDLVISEIINKVSHKVHEGVRVDAEQMGC